MPLGSDDYPYYSVEVTGNGQVGGQQDQVFSFNFEVTGPVVSNGFYPGMQESLFEALKSWAENFAWATPTGGNPGETYSLGTFSITEYSQQTTDITPA